MTPDDRLTQLESTLNTLEIRATIAEGLGKAQREALREMRWHLDLQWWLWLGAIAVDVIIVAFLWGRVL